MKIIGITGGIGTGKSTVLSVLEKECGAYIVETDKLAHHLMQPGYSAYEKIVVNFGEDILREDGTIHRGILGGIVFQDEEKLQQLNAIVHPAVKAFLLEDIELKKQEGKTTYYVIEAALLIEDGYRKICDALWYIYAPQSVRIQRLIDGRGGTEEKWQQVIANQSSEDFYRRHCDAVIDNSKGVEKTIGTIKELLYK